MARLSNLGRTIDPRNPSNLLAVLAALAVGALAFALRPAPFLSRAVDAVIVAIAAFLGWAIARELDPDHPSSANVTAVVGGALTAALGAPAVGALYLLLVTARILTRSTGLPPTPVELVLNLLVAGFVARTPPGWLAGMGLALALALDARLPDPAPPPRLWWAAGYAAVVSVVAGMSERIGDWIAPSGMELSLAVLGVLGGAAAIARVAPPASIADLTGTRLPWSRVRWSRIDVTFVVALGAMVSGRIGIRGLVPALVALFAVGVVSLLPRRV